MNYEIYLPARCESLWSDHLFRKSLELGQVSSSSIAYYLAAIGLLCRDTPNHLSSCSARALKEGLTDLAQFLLAKIGEEAGHDSWAEDDMKLLNKAPLSFHPAGRSKALNSHITWINELAASDVLGYLGYLYAAEAITAIIGPKFVQTAEKGAGFTPDRTSIIAKHIDLDMKHSAEGVEWINYYLKLYPAQDADQRVIQSIDRTLAMLDALWTEALQHDSSQFTLSGCTPHESMAHS